MILYVVGGFVVLVAILAVIGNKSVAPPPDNLTDDDIRDLAENGNKIQAIKWYRSLHGSGLKDAKEAVEKMINE